MPNDGNRPERDNPLTAGPFRESDLTDLETRRDAYRLADGIAALIAGGPPRDEQVILIALVVTMMAICEEMDEEPDEVLLQIQELAEDGNLELDDDPAEGRFVHPAVRV